MLSNPHRLSHGPNYRDLRVPDTNLLDASDYLYLSR
jgi:hypothetical protein